jgi:FhuF 2Fe-2S C-terminal domain
MSDDADVGRAALQQAGALGPFFRLDTAAEGPDWKPFADFYADRAQVAGAVAASRARLADGLGAAEGVVDSRVAASVWHLGVVARIVSPVVGAAAAAMWAPRLDRLLWRRNGDRQPLFAIRAGDLAGVRVATAADAAQAVHDGVVRTIVTPLTRTTSDAAAVSEHVLWGNVWSAFAGAAAVAATAGPDVGRRAVAVVRAVVETSDRPFAGRYVAPGRYRRDTCCLYYRLPGGGLCGDCVLHHVPVRRE